MLGAPSILRGQGVIELKLSHFVPPSHGMHTQFLEPWARQVEQRSDGALRIQVFPGTAALGNVVRQYDQVLAGVTDIGYGLTGMPRGRFPRTSVIEMPFLTPDAGVATRTLWAMLPKYLAEEYSQVKVLALHAHNGGLIHTRDKLVRTMDDRPGRKDAIARRNTITELSPQERLAWIAALQPMIEGWLDGLADDGVANAREISAEVHKLVAHYSKA
jgi:TRAP-type C4-dicarboxylate transport system substrate-binding protein